MCDDSVIKVKGKRLVTLTSTCTHVIDPKMLSNDVYQPVYLHALKVWILPFTPSASGICFRVCCPSASGLAVCQSHSEQRAASWVLVQGYRGNGVGGVAVRVS